VWYNYFFDLFILYSISSYTRLFYPPYMYSSIHHLSIHHPQNGLLVGHLKDCAFPLPMNSVGGSSQRFDSFDGVLLDVVSKYALMRLMVYDIFHSFYAIKYFFVFPFQTIHSYPSIFLSIPYSSHFHPYGYPSMM